MAVYINGVKVAGRGISGKSPYQIAVAGGYTGSEKDFNDQLVAIGDAVKGFNELSEQVASAKDEINTAVSEAQEAVNEAREAVEEASEEIDAKLAQAKQEIADALLEIPNSENLVVKADLADYALKTYVDDALASLVTDIYVASTTAPNNTKLLWIDTTASTGGLKYYNGSAWTHVPVAWS